MNKKLIAEIPLLILVALPFIYLGYIWNELPAEVPLHFNIRGEIDRWGSKKELWIIPILTVGLTYMLLLAVPFIDPKKKLAQMGNKYFQLRLVIVAFTTILALIILYYIQSGENNTPVIIFIFLGGFFTVLGNYMKTIKPNYFVGFRTPWTLENEEVWKKTHHLGGLVWFFGGILIMIMGFLLPVQTLFKWFMGVVLILTLVPLVYSYMAFKNTDNSKERPAQN